MKLKYILSGTAILLLMITVFTISQPSTKVTPFTDSSVNMGTLTQYKNQEQKSTITITSDNTYDTGEAYDAIVLGDKNSQEFIKISTQGIVMEFKYISVSFDGEKIIRGKIINEIPDITNKNITIRTTIPEGVPNEMILWKSGSGKEYSFIIGYDGVNGKINKTIEME